MVLDNRLPRSISQIRCCLAFKCYVDSWAIRYLPKGVLNGCNPTIARYLPMATTCRILTPKAQTPKLQIPRSKGEKSTNVHFSITLSSNRLTWRRWQ